MDIPVKDPGHQSSLDQDREFTHEELFEHNTRVNVKHWFPEKIQLRLPKQAVEVLSTAPLPKDVTRYDGEIKRGDILPITPPTRRDGLRELGKLSCPLNAHMPVREMVLQLDDLVDDRGRIHRQILVPSVSVVVGRTGREKVIPLLHLQVVRMEGLDIVEVCPPVAPLVGQSDVHQTIDTQRLPETLETPDDIDPWLLNDCRHPERLLALLTLVQGWRPPTADCSIDPDHLQPPPKPTRHLSAEEA
eukprot:2552294-Rhodomonas_salina.1